MPKLMPCPMPTCGAPIDAVHLVPQGMGAFTYVIRCDCGLSFDTGAQSEAAAADRWNERPASAGVVDERTAFEAWVMRDWPQAPISRVRDHVPKSDPRYGDYCDEILQCAWVGWQARGRLNGAPK